MSNLPSPILTPTTTQGIGNLFSSPVNSDTSNNDKQHDFSMNNSGDIHPMELNTNLSLDIKKRNNFLESVNTPFDEEIHSPRFSMPSITNQSHHKIGFASSTSNVKVLNRNDSGFKIQHEPFGEHSPLPINHSSPINSFSSVSSTNSNNNEIISSIGSNSSSTRKNLLIKVKTEPILQQHNKIEEEENNNHRTLVFHDSMENLAQIEEEEHDKQRLQPTLNLISSPKKSNLKKNSKYSSTKKEVDEIELEDVNRNENESIGSSNNNSNEDSKQTKDDDEEEEDLIGKKIDWDKYFNYFIYGILILFMTSTLLGITLYFIVSPGYDGSKVPKPNSLTCSSIFSLQNYFIKRNIQNNLWNILNLENQEYIFDRVETSSNMLKGFIYKKKVMCDIDSKLDPYCGVTSNELFRFDIFHPSGSTKDFYSLNIGGNTTLIGVYYPYSNIYKIFDCLSEKELGFIKIIENDISKQFNIHLGSSNNITNSQVIGKVIDGKVYDSTTSSLNTFQPIAIFERHKLNTQKYWYSLSIRKSTKDIYLFMFYHFIVPLYTLLQS